MAPYIGQFLLNLAAFTALIPLLFAIRLPVLVKFYKAQVWCLILAFLWLIKSHIVSDFSLINVIHHSHTQKPWLYKIAGTWGNHEGSMLLWVLLLGLFGLFTLRPTKNAHVQQTQIILHCALNLLFIVFLLWVCDPFQASAVPPVEGRDLNPLLQDPLLAIHPPFLYAGYVGFVVPFIYVLSNLFHELPPLTWLSSLRPMVLLPWTLLSIGLGLGSFWAYYELGWGGWWFWDPVENVALVPWLLGLLLIHSLLYHAHQQQAIRRVIALTVLTFIASLIGTLLVRSGLLTSVHSFAVDPERGILLLGLVLTILIATLFLIYKKVPRPIHENIDLVSRSGIVQLVVILTFAVLLTLVFGTLYPLLSSSLGYPITVGAPYFQMTFIPMVLPILCFLPFIPWLGWQKTDLTMTAKKVLPSLTLSGFLVVLLWHSGEIKTIKEIGFSWVALWIIISTFLSLKRSQLNRRFIGMSLAHGGIAIAILGMVLSSAKEQEYIKALKVGEQLTIASFNLKLDEIKHIDGPNYIAQQALIHLTRNEKIVATLIPEKRFYWTQKIIHGETAIHSSWLNHLYIALGEQYEDNIWSLRIYYKPYINLLWLGMICIAVAGVILCRSKKGIAAIVLLFALSHSSIAMEAHEVLTDNIAEQRAMHVGRMLLCPTCAGQNINDSVAEEAQKMRLKVRQLVLQGLGDTEVLDYFISQYGEHILYQPSLKIGNIVLWGAPWVVFLFCILFAWRRYAGSGEKH